MTKVVIKAADGTGAVESYHNANKKLETTADGIEVTGKIFSSSHIDLADNVKLLLGTGDDLNIFHDGTDSTIDNNTGALYIKSNTSTQLLVNNTENAIIATANGAVELYHDNAKVFETASNGAKVLNPSGNGTLSIIGSEGNDAILQLKADDGDDAADHWRIVGDADGSLYIQNWTASAWETNIKGTGNGNVELYYDNAKKLETTANGATITGATSAHGLHITNGDAYNQLGFNANRSGASQSLGYILGRWNNTDVAAINLMSGSDTTNKDDGEIVWYTRASGASMTERMRIDPDGKIKIPDNGKLQLGAGPDLEIYHDGSNSFVKDAGTGELKLEGNVVRIVNAGNTETQLKASQNGAVDLYYDNSKKFETTTNGIWVTGALKGDSLELSDNKKIILGTGDDLEIYHDGSHSVIHEVGTGGLKLVTDHSLQVRSTDKDTGEYLLQAIPDGDVELYYDGVKKFETNSLGATLTGTTNAKLDCSSGSLILASAHNDVALQASDDIFLDGNETYIRSADGGETLAKFIDNGSVELYYNNTKKFETNGSGSKIIGDIFPDNNGTNRDCGQSSKRWRKVYAANGTIDTSDKNEKNTIRTSDLGLNFINQLNPVSYKWNEIQRDNNQDKTHYGLIAQEVEEVIIAQGKTVNDFAGLDKPSDGPMGLGYTELISPLIKAIQELSLEVETLKTEIQTLKGA